MAPVLHHLATSDTKSSPDMSTIKPYTSNTDSPQDTEKHSLPDLGDTGAGTHHGDTDANVPTISTVRMCFLTAAMLLTWFLGTASAASVTLLLPVMVQDLNSNDLEMQWVVSAYTLAFGCGLLFTGRLADMYGRRKLYLIGLLTFLVFTAITGGLRNRVAMCFTRALSGLGLATAFPAGFGIVGSTIEREPARTIAFSLFGLGTPAGAFLGGLLAGGISTTNRSGWSYFFFVLAGVAAVNTAMAWFAAPHDPSRAQRGDVDRRIDWVGGVLVTAAICLFAFAFTDSGLTPKGWAAPHVPALLATSIVLFVLFYFWSRHLERNTSYPPIIKTSLFTRYRGRISAICICAFFASASVYSWVFTTAVFYQGFMRLTPWGNAIKILTSNITGICASLIIMIIAPRIKAPYILITAVTASGICSTLMAVRPEMSSFWSFEFPSQLLFPWGHDLTMTIGSILVSNLVEEDEQSVGGALFQTAGQIGGSLGICLSALISSEVTKDAGNLLMGLKGAYWFSAGTAFIIVPIVLVGLHGVGLAKNVRQAM